MPSLVGHRHGDRVDAGFGVGVIGRAIGTALRRPVAEVPLVSLDTSVVRRVRCVERGRRIVLHTPTVGHYRGGVGPVFDGDREGLSFVITVVRDGQRDRPFAGRGERVCHVRTSVIHGSDRSAHVPLVRGRDSVGNERPCRRQLDWGSDSHDVRIGGDGCSERGHRPVLARCTVVARPIRGGVERRVVRPVSRTDVGRLVSVGLARDRGGWAGIEIRLVERPRFRPGDRHVDRLQRLVARERDGDVLSLGIRHRELRDRRCGILDRDFCLATVRVSDRIGCLERDQVRSRFLERVLRRRVRDS